MDTLIIGGGAAGAAAAIAAAEKGERVTVLDRNRKPLKKLGVSGNGRGNVMNRDPAAYFGDDSFARAVFDVVPPSALRAFWEGLGVPLADDGEGRVYPAAYLASVAVDAMMLRMAELGVRHIQNTRATAILPRTGGFAVEAEETLYQPDARKANGKVKKGEAVSRRPAFYSARRVIVAAGGAAAPALGTDGSAYALLTALGHTLIPPRPALCALVTETGPIRGLEGQRIRAGLRLLSPSGKELAQSRGEALFAGDGVSGIAAMELGRYAEKGCTLEMDLREGVLGAVQANAAGWLGERVRRHGERPLRTLLTGAATQPLAEALFHSAGLNDLSRPLSLESHGEALARQIEAFPLPVLGTRGWDAAQVTAGGLETREFDERTMESKRIPGLYVAGEMLNVDGPCGGYNLMFAVASGLLAGRGSQE